MTLDLPMIFWKKLAGQTILFEDLEEIDKKMCEVILDLESSTEEFQDLDWTTQLSDGRIVELIPDGKGKKVEFKDRFDYVDKVIRCRANESQAQIEAVKKGLYSLIPEAFIKTIPASSLQLWVCGKKYVDIDLLKRNTRYSGGLNENSTVVKYMW